MSASEVLLLTKEQVSLLLQVPARTLDDWAYEGKGPAYIRPSGGKRLYPRVDLDKWLARQPRHGGAS